MYSFYCYLGQCPKQITHSEAILNHTLRVPDISIVSFWEMAIKLNLGKLKLEMSCKDLYWESDKNIFSLLPITPAHTEKIVMLNLHHRDSFD